MLSPLPAEGDRLFSSFGITKRKALVVAVSGGSDSLALLLLLKRWLDGRAASTRLVAITVDHGLREASAAEAQQVAALCARWGVSHRIVRWAGEKPASGVADAARTARYRLLADAAQDAGTDLVLTGHTLDDQAETVAMRLERAEGRGVAGMAGHTWYDSRVWVLRPLLSLRRQVLRHLLTGAEVSWIDDPSNENMAAERVRVRQRLAGKPEAIEELGGRAQQAGAERLLLGEAAAVHIDSAATVSPGLIRLPENFFETADSESAVYALRILLAAVGGSTQLPELERTRELLARLKAGPCSATLSRTLADRRRTGGYLHREARGLPEAATLVPGAVWDGRFRVGGPAEAIAVAALGRKRAAAIIPKDGSVPRSLAVAALAAEPGSPDSAASFERLVSPWAMFLPEFDIAPYNAAAKLLGAPLTPYWP